ncbi:MAG: sigma-70 family RNA polymerase sigma factor [Ruminococcaceae bacterium]|nr:sigma-70 family RNA polymerase sigma factor [Oscillospiraceae bacterium]
MNEFEKLLLENFKYLERFVNYKISDRQDAQDIIQETCLTASLKFETLRDKKLFKGWLIRIAGNKCNDYYRKKSEIRTVSFETLSEGALITDRSEAENEIAETIKLLSETDRRILYLYYFQDLSQKEISNILGIPIGTVKSRLHSARENFRKIYPYPPRTKGDDMMKKLPELLPEYTIKKSEKEPFDVKYEALVSWAIIPRLGEKCSMGIYYIPSRKMQGHIDTEVVGEAEIYGIRGVEIVAQEYDMEDYYRTKIIKKNERRFIAQLTDTHSRFLAESHIEDGVRMVHTFIDDDEFTENWGYGEDNCGNQIHLSQKNLIERKGNIINGKLKPEVVDIVGRYEVTIGGKTYDTVCVMDLNCYNDPVVSEEYIDRNGKTILFRRFNRDDWAYERFGKKWTEMLPDNTKLYVNGETYVHWYDCITDYIL